MAEMILPGVYIEVRPEGLIAPGQITVGNVGVVGTAARGPLARPFCSAVIRTRSVCSTPITIPFSTRSPQ